MDVQQQIKNNAEEVQMFIRDMSNWEKEMKRKEHSLLQCNNIDNDKDLPPVRNKLVKMENEMSEKPRDKSNLPEKSEQQLREQSLFEKERGNELVKQKKWTEAIFRYTRAIECFPKDATFYCNRAHCFLQLKKWAEAETDCTTALQIDCQYEKAYYRRALALKERNQFHEAHEDLKKVLEFDPSNFRVKSQISRLEQYIVNQETSAEVSSAVKTEIPKDKKQLSNMKKEKGNAFVRKKDWKSAIECYTEACALDPEDASFYLNRALCFLKTAEPKKAILDCIRVLELDPDNVKAYYRRALAYLDLGNLSEAHNNLLAAIRLDPSNSSVQDMLTKLEKDLGIVSEKIPDNENKLQTDEIKTEIPEPNKSSRRITGERFIRLGGRFVKPERKPPHLLSKKPLRKIKIRDKCEADDIILKAALDEAEESEGVPEISLPPNSTTCSSLQVSENSNLVTIDNKNNDENRMKINVEELPVPKTAMQFLSSWDKMSSSPISQYKYLKKIPGSSLPSIFKEALESCTFSEILDILATQFVIAGEPVFPYLQGFSRVKRFSALMLFANEDDNKIINFLFNYCEERNEVTKEELDELRTSYFC